MKTLLLKPESDRGVRVQRMVRRLDVENIGLGIFGGLFLAGIYYAPQEAICPFIGISVSLWVLSHEAGDA